MGQKVNPLGLRAGIRREWSSRWYANKHNFGDILGEDLKIRKYFEDKYDDAGIAEVSVERDNKTIRVIVRTSKRGVILGRTGEKADAIEKDLTKIIQKKITLEIEDVRQPELNATVTAEDVCRQLERRMPFRRVAKQAIQKAMEAGAKGAKVLIGGRLGGADMARSEFFTEGSVPLQTLRSDISYAYDRAETTYGTLGVKVWIYRGEKFDKKENKETLAA